MKITHIADLHLGHHKTPTEDIIKNLYKYFIPKVKESDIVFIAGDIFDMSVSMNNANTPLIISFFLDLFNLVISKKIYLRLLKGTHSHDKNQIRSLMSLIKPTKYIKYIEKMYYEYIEDLDLKLYYLPDDLPYKNTDDIIRDIRADLDKNNVDKVDYIICHGTMDFIFSKLFKNDSPKSIAYNSSFLSKLVKHYVLLGHIHIHYMYKKCIYSGSFDRLAQNEEQPKGFLFIDNNKVKFIVNKDATIYKTIDLINKTDLDYVLVAIKEYVKKHFKNEKKGFLRVFISDNTLKSSIKKFIKDNFKNIQVAIQLRTNKEENNYKLKSSKKELLTQPTEANIINILLNSLKINISKEELINLLNIE